MSTRRLLKLKHELDSLDIEMQHFRVDLLTFGLELKMKKKVEQPIVSTEEAHTQKCNEDNFDLPPKFDEYEEHKKETIKEEEKEEEMEGSMVDEPLKEGDILLTFLKPTLKAEPSEFKDLEEMILHAPSLDTQTEIPSHPLDKLIP